MEIARIIKSGFDDPTTVAVDVTVFSVFGDTSQPELKAGCHVGDSFIDEWDDDGTAFVDKSEFSFKAC